MFFNNFIESAEDHVINDQAEEIETAINDVVEDDYSDIDNIADIDEDNNCQFVDDEEEDDDDDDDIDEDNNDDETYVDYMVSDD